MAHVQFTMPKLVATGPGNPRAVTFSDAAKFLSDSADVVAHEATRFLTKLEDLSAIQFSQVGDLPAFNSVVWLGETPGLLDKPVRPAISIAPIQSLLDRLNALTSPIAPTTTFSYTDPGYSSQLRQPMINKLLNDVINGGYGIDTTDEIALFNRARDREAMLAAAAVAEVARQAAATGFPLPQGALYLAQQKARQDEMAKNSSVNRDIALKRADLFVENRRKVIEQILETEGQDMALYNAIQNRAVIVAQTEVQLAIALFDAGIRLFKTNIDSLTAQITANLESARVQVQIYASDVAAYAALVSAVVSGAEVDIANSKNVLTANIASYQARVDKIKFQLEQLKTTVENRKQINTYATDFFRSGFGAAINGVNGLAVQSGTA